MRPSELLEDKEWMRGAMGMVVQNDQQQSIMFNIDNRPEIEEVVACCVLGAIYLTAPNIETVHTWTECLIDHLGDEGKMPNSEYTSIGYWNDRINRTKENAVAVLKEIDL